jgi:lipid A disaccharide synthetase
MEQMFNYMLVHSRYRMTYYDAENIPIEEQHMDGIYEAQLTPEDIKKHRKEAADRAAERLQKQKKDQTELNLPYKPKFSLI